MSLTTKLYVAVKCDSDDECYPWDDQEGMPVFDSEADARKQLSDWRWQEDGATLCPRCAAEADCRRLGHDWGDGWGECGCGGSIGWHKAAGCPLQRFCERCGTYEREPIVESAR